MRTAANRLSQALSAVGSLGLSDRVLVSTVQVLRGRAGVVRVQVGARQRLVFAGQPRIGGIHTQSSTTSFRSSTLPVLYRSRIIHRYPCEVIGSDSGTIGHVDTTFFCGEFTCDVLVDVGKYVRD